MVKTCGVTVGVLASELPVGVGVPLPVVGEGPGLPPGEGVLMESTVGEAVLTAVPEPIAEIVADTGVQSGRTDEGAFFLGDPNAPIIHLDYSDFL